MKIRKLKVISISVIFIICGIIPASSQLKGLETITEDALRRHLEFIAADEFQGRETPSLELEICNLYLASLVRDYGLNPIMPDGSYYQNIQHQS